MRVFVCSRGCICRCKPLRFAQKTTKTRAHLPKKPEFFFPENCGSLRLRLAMTIRVMFAMTASITQKAARNARLFVSFHSQFTVPALSLERNNSLKQSVRRADCRRVRLEAALRHNHLAELVGEVDIRHFERACEKASLARDSAFADVRLT